MYTYPEIKLQNKQDAFCAMYHNICRSIFALCGAYEGEGVIRSAVRAAGEASGAEQLKKLTQAKACTDLSNLYRLGTDIVDSMSMPSMGIMRLTVILRLHTTSLGTFVVI